MPTSIEVKILTSFDQLLELRNEWDSLHSFNPHRTVFGTHAFAETWWRAYGEGLRLYTPVAYESGRVIGILPLVFAKSRLSAFGVPGADYFDILAKPEHSREVLESICSALLQSSDWDTCELENVPESSLLYSLLQSLPPWLKRSVRSRFSAACKALVLGEDRRRTLAAVIDKPSKKKHKNKLLSRPGTVFHNLDLTEAADHLERFFSQHIARRALMGERSQFLDARVCTFYRLLIQSPSIRESVRFSVLEENGTPVAYHFGFQRDGRFVLYKPTFDIDRWDDSPGEALNLALLNYIAADESVQIFDLTCGDEAYKSQYTNRATENYAISLYAHSACGMAARMLADGKQFLRSQPRLTQSGRRALQFFAARRKAKRGDIISCASQPRFTAAEIRVTEKASTLAESSNDYSAITLTLSKLAVSMANSGKPDPDLLREARARFKRKEQCLGVFSGDQLACAAWISTVAPPANGSTIYDLWAPYAGKAEDFITALLVLVKQITPVTFSPPLQEHFTPLLEHLDIRLTRADGMS